MSTQHVQALHTNPYSGKANEIYHMTHISNLDNVLAHGLYAHGNPYQTQDISNQAVNSRRHIKEPIHHRAIHDYVPFYFNPKNAMLYKTQQEHGRFIVILGFESSLINDAIITDGNAACSQTLFCGDKNYVNRLNWEAINSERWCVNGERNDEIKRQMMAETLVHNHVPIQHLQTIYCLDDDVKLVIDSHCNVSNINVVTKPSLFF